MTHTNSAYDLPDRITSKIQFSVDGCWPWLGCRDQKGYGQAVWGGPRQRKRIHVIVYEAMWGPVPDGLELDHLCRNKPCCRPDHLEVVTRSLNHLRGDNYTNNFQRLKETCPKGHTYNRVNSKGGRYCLTCSNALQRIRRARGL